MDKIILALIVLMLTIVGCSPAEPEVTGDSVSVWAVEEFHGRLRRE